MLLHFRHGFASAPNQGLEFSNGALSFVGTDSSCLASIAHIDNKNYLVDLKDISAKPNFATQIFQFSSDVAYVYLTLNDLGHPTFSCNQLKPIVSDVPPIAPAEGQWWFDSKAALQKQYNDRKWVIVAGLILATVQPSGLIQYANAGTQAEISSSVAHYAAYEVVYNVDGKAVILSDGSLLTYSNESIIINSGLNVAGALDTIRLAIDNGDYQVGELVNLTDKTRAQYHDTFTKLIGVVTHVAEKTTVAVQGVISNESWNWTVTSNKQMVWVSDGKFTDIDPSIASNVAKQPPVGYIIDKNTIWFDCGLGSDPHSHLARDIRVSGLEHLGITDLQSAIKHLRDTKVNKSGDTVTGEIRYAPDVEPTTPQSLVTKGYVDNLDLADLADVAITSPQNGERLVYQGGKWINAFAVDLKNAYVQKEVVSPANVQQLAPKHIVWNTTKNNTMYISVERARFDSARWTYEGSSNFVGKFTLDIGPFDFSQSQSFEYDLFVDHIANDNGEFAVALCDFNLPVLWTNGEEPQMPGQGAKTLWVTLHVVQDPRNNQPLVLGNWSWQGSNSVTNVNSASPFDMVDVRPKRLPPSFNEQALRFDATTVRYSEYVLSTVYQEQNVQSVYDEMVAANATSSDQANNENVISTLRVPTAIASIRSINGGREWNDRTIIIPEQSGFFPVATWAFINAQREIYSVTVATTASNENRVVLFKSVDSGFTYSPVADIAVDLNADQDSLAVSARFVVDSVGNIVVAITTDVNQIHVIKLHAQTTFTSYHTIFKSVASSSKVRVGNITIDNIGNVLFVECNESADAVVHLIDNNDILMSSTVVTSPYKSVNRKVYTANIVYDSVNRIYYLVAVLSRHDLSRSESRGIFYSVSSDATEWAPLERITDNSKYPGEELIDYGNNIRTIDLNCDSEGTVHLVWHEHQMDLASIELHNRIVSSSIGYMYLAPGATGWLRKPNILPFDRSVNDRVLTRALAPGFANEFDPVISLYCFHKVSQNPMSKMVDGMGDPSAMLTTLSVSSPSKVGCDLTFALFEYNSIRVANIPLGLSADVDILPTRVNMYPYNERVLGIVGAGEQTARDDRDPNYVCMVTARWSAWNSTEITRVVTIHKYESEDGGLTWDEPSQIETFVNQDVTCSFMLDTEAKGLLLLFGLHDLDTDDKSCMMMMVEDVAPLVPLHTGHIRQITAIEIDGMLHVCMIERQTDVDDIWNSEPITLDVVNRVAVLGCDLTSPELTITPRGYMRGAGFPIWWIHNPLLNGVYGIDARRSNTPGEFGLVVADVTAIARIYPISTDVESLLPSNGELIQVNPETNIDEYPVEFLANPFTLHPNTNEYITESEVALADRIRPYWPSLRDGSETILSRFVSTDPLMITRNGKTFGVIVDSVSIGRNQQPEEIIRFEIIDYPVDIGPPSASANAHFRVTNCAVLGGDGYNDSRLSILVASGWYTPDYELVGGNIARPFVAYCTTEDNGTTWTKATYLIDRSNNYRFDFFDWHQDYITTPDSTYTGSLSLYDNFHSGYLCTRNKWGDVISATNERSNSNFHVRVSTTTNVVKSEVDPSYPPLALCPFDTHTNVGQSDIEVSFDTMVPVSSSTGSGWVATVAKRMTNCESIVMALDFSVISFITNATEDYELVLVSSVADPGYYTISLITEEEIAKFISYNPDMIGPLAIDRYSLEYLNEQTVIFSIKPTLVNASVDVTLHMYVVTEGYFDSLSN